MAVIEKVPSKRLQDLERKEQELNDYYQAMKMMREQSVYMQAKAQEGSTFAEGWMQSQRDWAAILLHVSALRQGAEGVGS